jgi:hypothetical protein
MLASLKRPLGSRSKKVRIEAASMRSLPLTMMSCASAPVVTDNRIAIVAGKRMARIERRHYGRIMARSD